MKELTTLDIVNIPVSTHSGILRKNLATEAMSDAEWMCYYENVLEKNKTNIENIPKISKSSKLAYSKATNRRNKNGENLVKLSKKNKTLKILTLVTIVILTLTNLTQDFAIFVLGIVAVLSLGLLGKTILSFFSKYFINQNSNTTEIKYSSFTHNVLEKYTTTSWGVPAQNLEKAALCFQVRANDIFEKYDNYDYLGTKDLSTFDKINLIVEGELWLLATGATDFEQAASLGPGALGSYANILARSLGFSVEQLPLLVENSDPSYMNEESVAQIVNLKKWASQYITLEEWNQLINNTIHDFTSQGVSSSRTYKFAMKLYQGANI